MHVNKYFCYNYFTVLSKFGGKYMFKQEQIDLTNDDLYSYLYTIGEQLQQPIVIIDLKRQPLSIKYYNQSFAQLTGYDMAELLNKHISCLCGPNTLPETEQDLEFHILNKLTYETTMIHYKKDGTAFWNQLSIQPIQNSKKEATFVLIQCKDITSEMLEKMLHKIEHEVYVELGKDSKLEDILQRITAQVEKNYIRQVYCAIHVLQKDGTLKAIASPTIPFSWIENLVGMEVSPTTGNSENAIYMKDLSYIQSISLQEDYEKLRKIISTYNIQYCWSKPIVDNEKKMIGTFTIYIQKNLYLKQSDIDFLNKLSPIIALTVKHFKQKNLLKQLAYYDINIGIPNYHYFYKKLNEWIQNGVEGVILLIQPGEYTSIVDMYGRKVGDRLIKQIVHRIEMITQKNRTIFSRFSNSTFILGSVIPVNKVDDFIHKIIECTSQPFDVNGREMFISLKIGVSYFHQQLSIDESIRQADIAITKSRKKIGTVISYFEKETDQQIQRELNVLNELTTGLKNDELSVYLQPKVHLLTKEIIGFEALARWYSPVLGNVSPAEFISIAEHSGKIRDIDHAIFEKVLRWQWERKKQGHQLYPVSINVSPVHFYHDSFADDLLTLVRQYQIEPKYIKIEVTENFELFDFEKAKNILLKLKEHGYESSIDDFGVGFSSLSYLQRLPFSEIKIDKSFINEIHDSGMYAIVKSIVQLAKSLNMHAVAEGIETLEQYKTLVQIGCHTGQGYYFHKPMPIVEAEKLINSK